MAADSLASEHVVTKLVGNLSLADQPEAILRPEGSAKEESKPAVSPSSESAEAKEGNKKQLDAKDHRPFYPSNNYYGYYYPGQENTNKAWEDQTRFYGMDAADGQYTGAPSENGSLLYYPPGYGYGQNPYNPYNPYIPGGMVGADGQYMGQRPYYPGQFQQTPASRYFPSSPMHPPRQETGSVPASKANANGISGGKGVSKTTYKDGIKGAESGASLPRNLRPMSQIQLNQQVNGGASHGKDSMQFRKYSCGLNQGKVTMPYANINGMMYKPNPRQRGKFYGYHGNENWNLDGMNEQNRGPRTIRPKSSQDSSEARSSGYGEEQYNLDSFCVDYETAKFFVIKSYSEDDVHQSIKYNVWASTPNGNKKLDGAYQEAQKLSSENKACPVFLFFSVNASGQFCGVAEMIGSVDFEKSMDFWQQDKWNGFFPVKWHLVKDVPNSQFRQIILENNDNKPVTNSRDTQEIKFQQGLEMLKIFKNYTLRTSILDDFTYYEGRQRAMKEKKSRQQALQRQILAAHGGFTHQKSAVKDNVVKSSVCDSSGHKVLSSGGNCRLPASISLSNGDSVHSLDSKDSMEEQGSDSTKGASELQAENPRVLIVGSVVC